MSRNNKEALTESDSCCPSTCLNPWKTNIHTKESCICLPSAPRDSWFFTLHVCVRVYHVEMLILYTFTYVHTQTHKHTHMHTPTHPNTSCRISRYFPSLHNHDVYAYESESLVLRSRSRSRTIYFSNISKNSYCCQHRCHLPRWTHSQQPQT